MRGKTASQDFRLVFSMVRSLDSQEEGVELAGQERKRRKQNKNPEDGPSGRMEPRELRMSASSLLASGMEMVNQRMRGRHRNGAANAGCLSPVKPHKWGMKIVEHTPGR